MQKNMTLCKGFHALLNKHSSWSSPPLARAVSRLTFLLTLMFIPILSWAGVHFENEPYSKIVNHPTVDRPYLQLSLFMYDRDGYDGFFMHDAIEGGNKGPAIYIDGKYICSANNELAWPGSDNKGNDSGLEDDRKYNGYYGNKYTKTIDGVTYTVRFWDPGRSGDQYYMQLIVTMDKMMVGESHTIKIKGMWRINNTSTKVEEKTYFFNALNDPFDANATLARTNYNTVSISGKLNSKYGSSFIAVTEDKNKYNKGFISPRSLSYGEYAQGTSEFNQTLTYDDSDDKNYGSKYIYVQKSLWSPKPSGAQDYPKVPIYKWYRYSLPDFTRAQSLSTTADMWKKQMTISWFPEKGNGQSTIGTWSIYRYPTGKPEESKAIAEKLSYSENTRSYIDDIPEYDEDYTYNVVFVPKDSPDGKLVERLTTSATNQVTRSFQFSNFTVTGQEKSIVLNWKNPSFGGNESYSFKILRTEDDSLKIGWEEVGTLYVSNKGQTEYSYTDSKNLQTCHTYYYKIQTTMLENHTFELDRANILGGSMSGQSKVLSLAATKGDYGGLVKLSWEAQQVGTDATRYEVMRSTKGQGKWATIYKTSGTATSYSCEDNTALPGQYYDYKVVSITNCEGTDQRLEMSDDGFCRSTGIVSGRITYGTGTAVADTRVSLIRNNENACDASQFYSLRTNGTGDGVFLALNSDELNTQFGKMPFSMQMFVRPDENQQGKTPTLFDLGGKLKLQLGTKDETKGYPILLNDGTTSKNTSLYLPTQAFTSLTLAVSTDGTATLTCIDDKDSIVTATLTSIAKLNFAADASTGLCLGGSYASSTDNAFIGYIDEMRIFSGKALTQAEILKYYNHSLIGTEESLFAYWPVDEGIDKQTTAYDYSKTSGVANSNHGRLGPSTVLSNTVLPTEHQFGLFGITDSQGNFVIRGVPFNGDGTNYTIVPTKGIHEFSPSYSSRYVSASSLVHNSVDFTDVSSFPVSGKIYYAGTDYPVEGCTFYVDGDICSKDNEMIESAEDGSYTISVPIGDHFIQVKKNGHTFASNGRYPADPNDLGTKMTFDRKVDNLEFYDNTLVNFTGRIVGGDIEGKKPIGFGDSKNNIGITELVLTPLTDRYRLNVVKQTNGTSYSYETNNETVACKSATEAINSKAWRGAGENSKKLYIRTDSLTGEFSAMLPPLNYKVESMKVVATGLSIAEASTIDASNPLLEQSDSMEIDGILREYKYNCILRKTYHSDPSFTVVQRGHDDGAFGLKTYQIEDANGKLDINDIYTVQDNGAVSYKYGGAIFEREENYVFDLCGYEEYVNHDIKSTPVTDRVPLAGSIVTIENALSAEQKVYLESNTAGKTPGTLVELAENQLELDSLGKAVYKWKAGLPNITAPYSRTLSITYTIGDEDRAYDWSGNGLNGIILGALPTGNNFVTAGPDVVEMILRDPPGTGSSAEWTSGSVTSRTRSSGGVWTSESETITNTKLGVDITNVEGIGFAVVTEIKNKYDLTVGLNATVEGESAVTWSKTTTNTRTISTSSAPEYVGANGDVFIGSATNLIFGKARDVNFRRKGTSNEAELELKDVMTTGLDFTTAFNYSANYIENVLLPNLRSIRNSKLQTVANVSGYKNTTGRPVYLTTLSSDDPKFGSDNYDKKVWGSQAKSGPSPVGPSYTMIAPDEKETYQDSVAWCNTQISNWEKYLAQNEQEKVRAYEERSKYLKQNISFDSGSSVTMTEETEESKGSTYDVTATMSLILGNQWGTEILGTGVIWDLHTQTGGGTHQSQESEDTKLASFSYTLAEDGDDDALTVDVYNYGAYSPIFRTRGGQTSGPYEGEVKTKYYRPGTTIMEATMQIEVPQITVDVPSVTNVPTGNAANYTLRLTNASEIDEDVYYKLMMIDESNPNGAKLSIDGQPLTDNRIIKIPAGETITKALQLYQTDLSVLDYKNIGIVLASQVQYDPTSTWDQIADTVYVSAQFVPSSSAVTMQLDHTTLNSSTGDDLNISFSQFDRNYHNLKAFRIQYSKQGDTGWTLVHEYVLNEEDKTENNEWLPSTSTVTYKLPMKAYSDGEYRFRILAVSSYGNEEVTNSSEEIVVIKDMERPQPLGQPTPSNGILTHEDDLSITFNENILKGELTKEANFRVTGVMNGAKIDHSTALGMSESETTATTNADITLANKNFAIDAWVNIGGAGTLLSHGNGSQKFTLGIDEQNRLQVHIGGTDYLSKETLPQNQWIYLSTSFTNEGDKELLNAAFADDKTETRLFQDETVNKYEGKGKLTIGKKMKGAIHELTIWDEAHDITTALLNRNMTKNPSTAHLIGYWKMNEGEGTTMTDYARNRHLTMTQETWYINNENKAAVLDGTSHLDISTASISPLAADNCAIELWMRADQQKGEAELLQAGEVELWLNETGQLRLTSKDNTFEAGNVSLCDNTWHHIALNILRTGNTAVYVDGVRTLATSVNNVGMTASDKLIVGARRLQATQEAVSYDRQLIGSVDEIRLWNATLSADFLKAHRKTRLSGKEEGLVAYYPFEKKQLDSYNQVVTIGSAEDLTGSENKASYGTQVTYTDDAPALRPTQTETNVKYSYTASDNKIVFTIDEDAASVEGCTLYFTVKDVRDMNGNLSKPVCWSAYVNRKELTWNEPSISLTKQVGEEAHFTATFTNKGGKQQMWTLSSVPTWLKVSDEYGTTEALEETTLQFSVVSGTPIGKYEETLYLTGSDEFAIPLTISLAVKGNVPEWKVESGKYESTMSMIGTLSILGKPSNDTDDLVGVFIDGECRGVARPVYNERYDNYFVMMDIYGDDVDTNKPLVFQAYDSSTGIMYPQVSTSEEVSFCANRLIGKYAQPLWLEAADIIEQAQVLNKGWNWTSLYVQPEDMQVSSIFASVAKNLELVKNKSHFASFDKGQAYGNTFELDNKSMYKVRMSDAQELKLIGKRPTQEDRKITIEPGWNWIAYNSTFTTPIADAFAGMDPQDGDLVKGQYGFAFYDGYEWIGSLKSLTPGQGYMLQSVTSENRTFEYPLVSAYTAQAKAFDMMSTSAPQLFNPIDHHKYPGNMCVIAQVTYNGVPVAGAEIGVFDGQECRTAEMTDDEGFAYLTIPGDDLKTLQFRMPYEEKILVSDVTINYSEDAIYGSHSLPFRITFDDHSATVIKDLEVDVADYSQWYNVSGIRLQGKPSTPGLYIHRSYNPETKKFTTISVTIK